MTHRLPFVWALITSLSGLFFLLSAGLPVPAVADSTVACHCFRVRSFSAEAPAAFDPYLLATIQNRLLAHVFRVPRKEVVRTKMEGLPGERLWVAHRVARAASVPLEEVLAAYHRLKSWRAVVQGMVGEPAGLGAAFSEALAASGTETDLAWAVVSDIMVQSFALPQGGLSRLRAAGATLQESILAGLLGEMTKTDSDRLWQQARGGGSWGEVLARSGETIDSLETRMLAALAAQSRR